MYLHPVSSAITQRRLIHYTLHHALCSMRLLFCKLAQRNKIAELISPSTRGAPCSLLPALFNKQQDYVKLFTITYYR